MEIFESFDYEKFKLILLNRSIDKKKVEKMTQEIKERPYLAEVCPILVNDDLEIFDGQHRFFACKSLKAKIFYIKDGRLKKEDIITLNKDQKNWNLEDYIQYYVKSNNNNYIKFTEIRERLDLSTALCAVFIGLDRKSFVSKIKNGHLAMPDTQDLARAFKRVELIKEFQKKIATSDEKTHSGLPLSSVFSFSFQESIAKLPNTVDEDAFFQKLFENKRHITLSRGCTQYLNQYKALGII